MNHRYCAQQAVLNLSSLTIQKLCDAGMSGEEFRSYDLLRPNFWTKAYTNDQVSDFVIYLYDKFFWKPRYRSEDFVRLLVTLRKALSYATHHQVEAVRLRPSELKPAMWLLIAGRSFFSSGGNEEALRLFVDFKVPFPVEAEVMATTSPRKRLVLADNVQQSLMWSYAHQPEAFGLLRTLMSESILGYCSGVSIELIVKTVNNLDHLVEAGLTCDVMNQMGFFRMAVPRNLKLTDWLIDHHVCYNHDSSTIELPITKSLRIDYLGEDLYNKIMKHIIGFIETPSSLTPRLRCPQRAPHEWVPLRKIGFSRTLLEYSLVTGWYTFDTLWIASQELTSAHEVHLKEFVQNFVKESIYKSIKKHEVTSPR
jgi:hypothetical protein